jgi:adenylate cyclase
MEQAIAYHDLQQQHAYDVLYGQDPGVQCLQVLAWTLWFLGYPEQALQSSYRAGLLAQDLGHPSNQVAATYCAARLRQLRRDVPETYELAEATIASSSEQGLGYYLSLGTFVRGWARFQQGQHEKAVDDMHRALAARRAVGGEVTRPPFLALLADAYGQMGQAEEGFSLLDEARTLMDKNGQRYYDAELHRFKGELLIAQSADNAAEAETCFQKALDVARSQQAKSLELRAATGLARLWQSQGKRQEAYGLLQPVYAWFTEGFDTADLKDAKALLDELAEDQS